MLARWLANPIHLCYANLGYALLYINIWQEHSCFFLLFFPSLVLDPRQYKRIERTSGCFFFCLRDIFGFSPPLPLQIALKLKTSYHIFLAFLVAI